MSEIVLLGVRPEISLYMLKRSNRPSVVECIALVRYENEHDSARFKNTFEFLQCTQWICYVLEHVGSQHEIVGFIRNHRKIASIRHVPPAKLNPPILVLSGIAPNGFA